MKNGVFERLVENWLTRANEREYQFPFCQTLLAKGYRLLHLSVHGPQEQGKDIIALDEKRRAVGYQLKTGNLDTAAFRAIAGELAELVELPIKFPGVRADGRHRSVLVTNGSLSDPVRDQIVDRNSHWKRRGFSPLEVMTKDEVLREFIDTNAAFFPIQLKDVDQLLELYVHPGNGPLPYAKWAEFLRSNVPVGDLPERRQSTKVRKAREARTGRQDAKPTDRALARHVSSAALLAGYALHPFTQRKNHWAVFEGWTMVAAHTLAVAERYGLDERWWKDSFTLSFEAALSAVELLVEEATGRTQLLEGNVLVDSFVY